VGVPLPAELPSPQRPSSRVSKNPNTEKSPCVIVALAAVDHNVTIAATLVTSMLHRMPRPFADFPFSIDTPKPSWSPRGWSNHSPLARGGRHFSRYALENYERALASTRNYPLSSMGPRESKSP